MQPPLYEHLTHPDPSFPVISHYDITDSLLPHWHESIEMLLFTKGTAQVTLDASEYTVGAGDLLIVNSGSLHTIFCPDGQVEYYCLIIGLEAYDAAGLSADDYFFEPVVRDEAVTNAYLTIMEELQNRKQFYQTAVRAQLLTLLITLLRSHARPSSSIDSAASAAKLAMVKRAIRLMQKRCASSFSLSDLAAELGFSRSYLCHAFRSLTGMTVLDYLNSLRCAKAQGLLAKGHTVSEAAQQCGFESQSYFTKLYKRYLGKLPSEERTRFDAAAD